MTRPQETTLALIGPTAVGKTELSLQLAEEVGGEILSVDSRQVYRYLDVGTDKVSPETRKRVLHHAIDVADPDDPFSVADFLTLARNAIRRIRARGRIPLLVGGTPFSYRALEGGLLSQSLPSDAQVRSRLEEEARERGREILHGELAALDPEAARRIHPRDVHRTVRALEIFRCSGQTPSWWYAQGKTLGGEFRIRYVGLIRPREELWRRIEERVRFQFSHGYPEEVRWLLEQGYDPRLPSLQGFGYRELAAWCRGTMTLEEALEGDIRATKAFSRRQMTWFRRFTPCVWYDLSERSREDVQQSLREAVIP